MKTLDKITKKVGIGLAGLGFVGLLNFSGCTPKEIIRNSPIGAVIEIAKEDDSVPPEFDYSKMPEEYKVLRNIFICNYWDDKNKDGKPQFDEVVGLKNVFYSKQDNFQK